MKENGRFLKQKLAKFKVIFGLFNFRFYFIQQQKCKPYYAYLLIVSKIQCKSVHIVLVTAQNS